MRIMKVLGDIILPRLTLSLFGPGLISLLYVSCLWLTSSEFFAETIACIVGTCLFSMFVESQEDGFKNYKAYSVIGLLVFTLLATVNVVINTPFSLTKTTLLAFGLVIFLDLGQALIEGYIERSQKKKCEAQERAGKEKERLISKVKQLVGDDVLAKGFMTALDELTKHVPDQATELLEALTSDLEEFQVLESLIGSTENELLKQRSMERLGAIQSAVQQTCAEVTEEAVEMIRLRQMSEADAVLGNKDEPKLVQARENFNHFLEGLREVRSITSPTVDPLIDEIEPKAEVLKIEPPKKSIK